MKVKKLFKKSMIDFSMTNSIKYNLLKNAYRNVTIVCLLLLMVQMVYAGEYKLVVEDQLTVALTGDMPGIVVQGNKLVGYDGEVLQKIIGKLGLNLNPAQMEWSGVIASVLASRVDIMGGQVGWTKQRAKTMVMSDPIMYFKNGIAQSTSTNWNKLADLEGKRVGSITGFSFIPELEKIKDIRLSLYDTSDAAVRDLLAGRIEAVIADPPVMQYAISRNPDWNIKFDAFTDNNPEFPLLTGLGQFVFGMNKKNAALGADIDAEIASKDHAL